MNNEQTKVTIYTSAHCPYCTSAKTLFTSLGVSFQEINIDNDPQLRAKISKENGNYRTVPMIFIGKDFMGGFDHVNALHQKGLLMEKIQALE